MCFLCKMVHFKPIFFIIPTLTSFVTSNFCPPRYAFWRRRRYVFIVFFRTVLAYFQVLNRNIVLSIIVLWLGLSDCFLKAFKYIFSTKSSCGLRKAFLLPFFDLLVRKMFRSWWILTLLLPFCCWKCTAEVPCVEEKRFRWSCWAGMRGTKLRCTTWE